MDEDKKKICDWIMNMDIDDFYDLCECLAEGFEFTGEQPFYPCSKCAEEHSEECDKGIDTEMCKEFFVEHYMKSKDREENANGKFNGEF